MTLTELLERYGAALRWFQERGANLAGSRLLDYDRELRDAAEAMDRGEQIWEWPPERRRAHFAVAVEVFDVIQMAGLNDNVIRGHRQKVQEVANGSTFYDLVEPIAQDQGRDAAFELLTAIGMQRAGATVTLDDPSDVKAQFEDWIVLLECKRPKTPQAYARLLFRASGQFSQHRRAGHAGTGVVAVDLTRLINPDLRILPAADRQTAQNALHAQLANKLVELRPELARYHGQFHDDAEINAILVRATAMTINEGENRPEVSTAIQVRPYGIPGTAAFDTALRFCAVYQQAGENDW